MNGNTASNAMLLGSIIQGMSKFDAVDLAVFAPFPYLAQVADIVRATKLSLGAQTVSEHLNGAFTGEVSGPMLAEFDCKYVLVGHSERRTIFGESDVVIAKKFAAAVTAGMIPVLCVGETLEEREAGATATVVTRQIEAVLHTQGCAAFANAIVAYEPVWAIGTGLTASPGQAQEVHALIRAQLAGHDTVVADKLRILYGGSMKPSNAKELLGQPDIDGGLIGGASLVAEDFLAIAAAA